MKHGIFIQTADALATEAQNEFLRWACSSPWADWLVVNTDTIAAGHQARYQLSPEGRALLTPQENTLHISGCDQLINSDPEQALVDEILLGLLSSHTVGMFNWWTVGVQVDE